MSLLPIKQISNLQTSLDSKLSGVIENGINMTNGTIGLGGTLTKNITFDGQNSQYHVDYNDIDFLSLSFNDGSTPQNSSFLFNDDGLRWFSNGVSGNLLFDLDGNKLQYLTETVTMSNITEFLIDDGLFFKHSTGISANTRQTILDINATSNTFIDGHNEKGLVYGGDYSENFTNRSLVDKEYVDNISGIFIEEDDNYKLTRQIDGNKIKSTVVIKNVSRGFTCTIVPEAIASTYIFQEYHVVSVRNNGIDGFDLFGNQGDQQNKTTTIRFNKLVEEINDEIIGISGYDLGDTHSITTSYGSSPSSPTYRASNSSKPPMIKEVGITLEHQPDLSLGSHESRIITSNASSMTYIENTMRVISGQISFNSLNDDHMVSSNAYSISKTSNNSTAFIDLDIEFSSLSSTSYILGNQIGGTNINISSNQLSIESDTFVISWSLTTPLITNIIYNIRIERDSLDNNISLYIDGVLVNTQSDPFSTSMRFDWFGKHSNLGNFNGILYKLITTGSNSWIEHHFEIGSSDIAYNESVVREIVIEGFLVGQDYPNIIKTK